MKRRIQQLVFSMAAVMCMLHTHAAAGSLSLNASLDPVYDTNVYKDSSQLSDSGFLWRAGVDYAARLRNLYPRVNYRFSGVHFNQYDYENYQTHAVTGMLLHRTLPFLSVGLEAGGEKYLYEYATAFNSEMYFVSPFARIYPSFFTEIELAYMAGTTAFPDYDLDNTDNQARVQLSQEIGWDMTLTVSGSISNRRYSERYIYDAAVTTAPVVTDQKRSDSERILIAGLKKSLGSIGSFELGYYGSSVDSNANEFSWGPLQPDLTDTPGDERIIDDFWSNAVHRGSILYRTGSRRSLLAEMYAHLQYQDYDGWLARAADETIIEPLQYRRDTQVCGSVKLERQLSGRVSGHAKYTYIQNNSNDKPYDYDAHTISAGINISF